MAELCGSAWVPDDIANVMTDPDETGVYTKVYENVAPGTYELKVTDGTWDNSWGATGSDYNYVFTIESTCDVTIRFDSIDCIITAAGEGVVVDEEDILLGDVIMDGRITIGDVAMLYAHVKMVCSLNDAAMEVGDYTGEGKINMMDVIRLYAVVKGL